MDFDSDYLNALDKYKEKEPIGIPADQIGISHGIGDVGKGLKSNIFLGASTIELGFMGKGKGFRSQPTGSTPESYGADERREMRELARVNEVEVTTHASPNIGSIGGFNPQQNTFSEAARQDVLDEIKKAIDFAADVADGGPIVFHTQEFTRPLEGVEGETKFREYEGEAEKKVHFFVDKKTEQLAGFRHDDILYKPVEKEEPFIDPVTGKKIPIFEHDKQGQIKMEGYTFDDFKKTTDIKEEDQAALAFYREQLQHQVDNALGTAQGFESRYKLDVKEVQKISKKIQRDEKVLKNISSNRKEERQRYKKIIEEEKQKLLAHEKKMDYDRETSISARRQAERANEQMNNMTTIKEHGVDVSAKNIAKAAMYAYDVEKREKTSKPLFVAPENWDPRMYGSHPEEYKKLITESRNQMTNDLMKKGESEDSANKIAKDHIKGTFDIGHFNLWRKYYTGKPKDFEKWVDKNVKDLVKGGFIGHVHLADNFGYDDEHLNLGEGNARVREYVETLKEEDYKGKIIVEPGGQAEGKHWEVFPRALGIAGSPIYRVDVTSRTWTDIQGSYFGQTRAPNYIVGDYAPNPQEWTLWSGTQLE